MVLPEVFMDLITPEEAGAEWYREVTAPRLKRA
jgi:hypothetical protein